jgi:hypothetical protein
MELISIKKVKINPNNPRIIKDDNFKKLVRSVIDFPEMLKLRPIVVNEEMIILGGNRRYRACVEAGLTEVPVIIAKGLTPDQQNEFLIKDNVSGGDWDWDLIANNWDQLQVEEWGLNIPIFLNSDEDDIDYSLLDNKDLDGDLDDMVNGVRKAVQIEFEPEHYEEALELIMFWRKKEMYIGAFLVEQLKLEKDKLEGENV